MRSAAHQNALALGAPAEDDPEEGDAECMEEEDREHDDELDIGMEDWCSGLIAKHVK